MQISKNQFVNSDLIRLPYYFIAKKKILMKIDETILKTKVKQKKKEFILLTFNGTFNYKFTVYKIARKSRASSRWFPHKKLWQQTFICFNCKSVPGNSLNKNRWIGCRSNVFIKFNLFTQKAKWNWEANKKWKQEKLINPCCCITNIQPIYISCCARFFFRFDCKHFEWKIT